MHPTQQNLLLRYKKTIFFVAFFALSTLLLAFKQPLNNYKLITTIPTEANFISSDFLKQVYVINKKNQLIRYDSTGQINGSFGDNKYGSLSYIDATSPFNLMLFYKDLGNVITTDLKLNVRQLTKLSSIGINNAAAACLSQDNYIWVFDQDDQKLKKINKKYEVIEQSLSMQRILGNAVTPNFLLERDGLIYLNVPNQGIILFDVLGTFYTAISASDLSKHPINSFQVINQKILYFDGTYLNVYDLATQDVEWIAIPSPENTKMLSVEKQRLYLLNAADLKFYAQEN